MHSHPPFSALFGGKNFHTNFTIFTRKRVARKKLKSNVANVALPALLWQKENYCIGNNINIIPDVSSRLAGNLSKTFWQKLNVHDFVFEISRDSWRELYIPCHQNQSQNCSDVFKLKVKSKGLFDALQWLEFRA